MERKQKAGHNLRIGQIFSNFSAVLTVLGWLGLTASSVGAYFRRSWLLALVAIISAAVLGLLYVFKRNHRRIISGIMSLFAPNHPYRILSWDMEYEYKSRDEMFFRVDYTVKAMQTGVDHIRVRYNWSGETDSNPIHPEIVTGQGYETSKLEFDGKEYGYSYYKLFSRVVFNKKDEPFKLGVRIGPLKAGEQKVSHHLLTSISMATDELIMRVRLPEGLEPFNVRGIEFLHATDDFHWHIENREVERLENKDWRIEWRVLHPIYGGKYIIKWSLPD